MSTAKKIKNQQSREQKKALLMKRSEQRAKDNRAPNYGIREGELLEMRQNIRQLVNASNNQHEVLREYQGDIKQRVIQGHYMAQVILKLLVDKGLATVDEIESLTREVQSKDNGYSSKGPGAVAEYGDLLLISFTLYDGQGNVVDDKSKEILAYNLGSGGLPCDQQLIGIAKGEMRHLTVVFGEGFTHKDFIGQELFLHLQCHDIQIKAIKEAS